MEEFFDFLFEVGVLGDPAHGVVGEKAAAFDGILV